MRKIFIIFLLGLFLIGCNNNEQEEIDFSVKIYDVTDNSCRLLLFNDQNLNLDNLVVELYKNEIFIKEIRDYQFIDDLESDQEYIIKYYYNDDEIQFDREIKFKTLSKEYLRLDLNLYLEDIGYDYIKLDVDNPHYLHLESFQIKLYDDENKEVKIDDIKYIKGLSSSTNYKLVYSFYNGSTIIEKQLDFKTKTYDLLDNYQLIYSFSKYLNLYNVSISYNDIELIKTIEGVECESNTFVIDNLNNYGIVSIDYQYKPLNSTNLFKDNVTIDLNYAQEFINCYKFFINEEDEIIITGIKVGLNEMIHLKDETIVNGKVYKIKGFR